MNPAVILSAAAFTGAVSLSAGFLLFQFFDVRLRQGERVPLCYVLGSAVLSLLVFVLCVLRIAHAPVFGVLGIGVVGLCIWRRAWRVESGHALDPVPRWWKWMLTGGFAAYGVFTFVHALAPETSPDGTAYHLGTVGRYFRNGGFDWYTTNFYASLPAGVEMLFLYAYSFGRHSAAALLHWQFFIVLPWLILNCGRRFGAPAAGAIAALLVLMSPVAGVDGASAYVDIATAAAAFSVFYLAMIWEAGRAKGLLPLIGLAAGWVYACKMTGFPAVPFALAFVAVALWRSRELRLRPLITVGLFASLAIVPWLAKNAIIVGNPFSPFLNAVFRNPHVTIEFENEYRRAHRDYYGAIKSRTEIPREVTVGGGRLNGILGPVFLLAPVGLVALRWPLGRRALAAAAFFLAAYPSNVGTRFLITAVPFVSLAMGLVFSTWRGTGAAVVLFHAFLSWPGAVKSYAHENAWKLDRFRWKAALRLESEDEFLARHVPYYRMAQLIDKHVPPDGNVLTFGTVAEAYTSREILVIYESARNAIAGEMLAAGAVTTYHPLVVWEYSFAPRKVRRFRMVQTNTAREPWNVNELRAFTPGGETGRDGMTRVTAHPFPWTVQFAFYNNPLSRWRSWQPASPGDWIQMDFGREVELASVRAELSPDQRTAARLQVETSPGRWETLAAEPKILEQPPVVNSRLRAADQLKRLGITHISVGNNDHFAEDLFRNQKTWGITLLGEASFGRLYRID